MINHIMLQKPFGEFGNDIALLARVLVGIDSVIVFITVQEQSQSNQDCWFQST